jgi:uncharacterized peroxidase-related enzyme
MSFLPQTPPDEKTAALLKGMKADVGFIPNFFRAQTLRPDFVESEAQLMGTILLKEGGLTRQQKEYIFLVCSAANLNTYCVTAHCEIVRMLGLDGPEPEQIAIDYGSTAIPIQMKALLNFAAKLNGEPASVGNHDVAALRTFGFTDKQIMETIVVVGFAKFANTVSAGLGTVPDFDSSKVVLKKADSAVANSPL